MATQREEKFRFVVKVMPPRRPGNSLLRRLGQSKDDEPMHTIAVPAVASERFADVWKHIEERYERNYGAEEVAKGYFHKLQDRYGADIASHDIVGDLGYGPNSPREDLTLVMLQNAIDRDGSIPDDSGLRPPGFAKRRLTGEQQEQVKRRKVQAERFGVPLDEVDEDTPILSRERTFEPENSDSADAGAERQVDADGFTVPAVPGPMSRKRKKKQEANSQRLPEPVQSSMEGEQDSDVLVPDSQEQRRAQQMVPDSFPTESHAVNGRSARSVPAEGGKRGTHQPAPSSRAHTAAPQQRRRHAGSVEVSTSSKGDAHVSRATSPNTATEVGAQQSKPQQKPKGPPTPVSGKLPQESQQPPESAQRPKPTPLSTAATAEGPRRAEGVEEQNYVAEEDPIEDDVLLQGTAGTDNEPDDLDAHFLEDIDQPEEEDDVYAFPNTETKTPASMRKKMLAHTPGSSAPAPSISSHGSGGRNPRSQHGPKSTWTAVEDAYLLDGLRQGLSAPETLKKFRMTYRSASAARSRRILLASKDPSLKTKAAAGKRDAEDDSLFGSSQRQPWTNNELLTVRKAISEGYDALEIQERHFPQRSQDSVNRKVLMLQDKAWKLAEREEFWPDDSVHLDDWTAKDNCKLKRAFAEGMPMQEVKDRFFGRWSMHEVQQKVNAYKKQIKAQGATPSLLAKKLASSAEQGHVNSSPVQRAVEARETRKGSEATLQRQPAHVASTPSRPELSSGTNRAPATDQANTTRSSSPKVRILSSEQDSARHKMSRQSLLRRLSSGNSRQTHLNFTREKGKGRAGPARPSNDELDAQYTRRSSARTSAGADTSEQQVEEDDERVINAAEDDHTPADDLEKLQAEVEAQSERAAVGEEQKSPRRSTRRRANSSAMPPASEAVQASPADTRSPKRIRRTVAEPIELPPGLNTQTRRSLSGQAASSDEAGGTSITDTEKAAPENTASVTAIFTKQPGNASLQSPLDAQTVQPSAVSRLSTPPFPAPRVDLRAAEQLSRELQRSISREAPEQVTRASQDSDESQFFQTQDPKTSRSQRTAKETLNTPGANKQDQRATQGSDESQAFQTQNPETSKSQRAAEETPKTPAANKTNSPNRSQQVKGQAMSQQSETFSSQNPTSIRSQRAEKLASLSPADHGRQTGLDQNTSRAVTADSPGREAFQIQDPASNQSQRALQTPKQTSNTPSLSAPSVTERSQARPSPYDILTQNQPARDRGTPTTVATSLAPSTQSGRLPARGQSYAARLREAQNVSKSQPTPETTKMYRVVQGPSSFNVLQTEEPKPLVPREQRSPSPSDSSIWKQTATAEDLGMDRQELFEDLRRNTRSIRAMKYDDWDEVARIRGEQRRANLDRKIKRMIARGEHVPEGFGLKQPPERATDAENFEAVDGNVIRDEDIEDVPMTEDESIDVSEPADVDEEVVEELEEMDRGRHFSEVEDDDDLPEDPKVDRLVSAVAADADIGMDDAPAQPAIEEEVPFAQFLDNDVGEGAGELELPTVPVLSDPQDTEPTPLTQEALQELENSGAEASPRSHQKKRKSGHVESSPKAKHKRQDSADKAAMPPPPLRSTVTASSSPFKSKKQRKRAERRKRRHQRTSVSGSERSSSVVPSIPTSDPAQHVPATPRLSSSFTAINRGATPRDKPSQSQTSKKSQPAPNSSNTVGGGLLSMARNAHIPTPPKRKPTPRKQIPGMSTRKSDDESDEESSASNG